MADTAAWCRSWLRASTFARSCLWCGRRWTARKRDSRILSAIAATVGPGLVGSLLVGLTYAKSLSFASGVPLIAVNHIEGHIHAVVMEARRDGAPVEFPALALVVSGGHTHMFEVRPGVHLSSHREDTGRCRGRSFRQSRQAARLRLSRRSGGRPAGAVRRPCRGAVHLCQDERQCARLQLQRVEDGGVALGGIARHGTRDRGAQSLARGTRSAIPCAVAGRDAQSHVGFIGFVPARSDYGASDARGFGGRKCGRSLADHFRRRGLQLRLARRRRGRPPALPGALPFAAAYPRTMPP